MTFLSIFSLLILLLFSTRNVSSLIKVYFANCAADISYSYTDDIRIKVFNAKDGTCDSAADLDHVHFNEIDTLKCAGQGKGKCKWTEYAKDNCEKTVKKEDTEVIINYNNNGNVYERFSYDGKLPSCCGTHGQYDGTKCRQTYQFCDDAPGLSNWDCYNKASDDNNIYERTGIKYNSNNNNYILIKDTYRQYNFQDADNYCFERFETHLASFHSFDEWNELVNIVSQYGESYVGLNDIDIEGTWVYTDNSNFDYPVTWFDMNQPDNWQGNQDCLVIRTTKLGDDMSCDTLYNQFVCNSPNRRRRELNVNKENLIKRLTDN